MLKNEGFNIMKSKNLKKEILDLHEVTFPLLVSSENNRTLNLLDEEVFLNQRHNFRDTDDGRVPLDYDALLNDHYFNEIIRSCRGREMILNTKKEQTLQENNRVLQLIRDELKAKS